MRRKENSKSKYTKQKFRLPSGTALFLHLLECHYYILKLLLSIMERGRGTDNTRSPIWWAHILSNVALKCRLSYSKDTKWHPLCSSHCPLTRSSGVFSLGQNSGERSKILTGSHFYLELSIKGTFCWNCSYQPQIAAFLYSLFNYKV